MHNLVQKETRVTITYDVLCPTHEPAIKGVQPRDINNFWMATDPDNNSRDGATYGLRTFSRAIIFCICSM